jgi:ComF family protein
MHAVGWTSIGRWFLDTLVPPRCTACDALLAHRALFCPPCAVAAERIESQGAQAPEHLGVFVYAGSVAEAIRRLKYHDRPDLAVSLGKAMADVARRAFEAESVGAVVPIALFDQKLRSRGYNQAALLARPVARALRCPLRCNVLERVRDTAAQATLAAAVRCTNMQDAFFARDDGSLEGRHVLLVDDVMTTGATLRAAHAALMELERPPARITALVCAATVRTD